MGSVTETSKLEKELFKYTNEGNYYEVKRMLTSENVSVNCLDEDGMTPLQHAAYKGDFKLCKLLLDCGADVNLTRHSSQYSTLMFAGLSGKVDVVTLLLEHGAITSSVNSINKTASQMAAFVGNHNVVSAINNFIQIEEIEYFTRVSGFEKEPKLPLHLCQAVHKMAIMTNIHPVRLAMYIQNNIFLLENAKKVVRVFNILSEKKFKEEGNELLSLKFHHLAFVLTYCEKFYNEAIAVKSDSESSKDCLNLLIKRWIKGDKNGFPEVLERFLRQDIKEYPFLNNNLFQQLVRTLASTSAINDVSAIAILSDMINRQRSPDEVSLCTTCGEAYAEKKCSACKSVQYCDKTCQKLHWFTHKTICSEFSKTKKPEKKVNEKNLLSESEELVTEQCKDSQCSDKAD